MPGIFWLVPAACVVTVIFAIWLIVTTLKRSTGTPEMKKVGDMIYEGAWAFLKRQYGTIGMISVVVAVVIAVLVGVLQGQRGLESAGITAFGFAWRTGIAFLVGAICSGAAGFIGMIIAVKSNVRCAAASQKSLNEAVQTAMRGAAVPGFLIVVLSLIGVTIIYFAFGGYGRPDIAPNLILGFGFGASFVALFAQLGGGIYTKAADMGADLVGKVEAGIPEDDPRNAAVIADLVGDNVGDCAGRGADLFESTAAENIGAMILGISLYLALKDTTSNAVAWILFPMVVRSFGLIACIIGLMSVRIRGNENPMNALNRGYFVSVAISAVGMILVVWGMLSAAPGGWGWLAGAGLIGIVASVVIVFVTQFYTEGKYRPVKSIVESAKTGPATVIVMGTAVGFESTLLTSLVIGVSLLGAYWMGSQALAGVAGLSQMAAGAFGTAIATMGMLMTCAYILTEDTFGPITDNANGVNEFAHSGPEVRRITDRLDAVGNTTKALTKGYAMVSAGLAAFLLFQAYLERVAILSKVDVATLAVDLVKPEVFVGALLAAMLVYFFCSLAIRAVSKTATKIIEEVRRQFHANPGIMQGTVKPDYAKAVDITAKAALSGMIAPGLLPVLAPLVIGLVFRFIPAYSDSAPMVVAAVLMVGTIGGIMMAAFMNNGGGAWDNAKKYIEDNQLKDDSGKVLGKGSDAHKAAVVGDTVGDPFKDTAGPSVHVLVKLLATITLVLAPLFVKIVN
jgi:K(+)-stimulated pyrophosphate-energized sodium pump